MESKSSPSHGAHHLGHVLLPKKLESMDLEPLEVLEKIKRGHTFIHALLLDIFRAMNIVTSSLSKYLECCVSFLLIWFLKHIMMSRPLLTKGLLRQDLISPTSGECLGIITKVGKIGRCIWRIFNSTSVFETSWFHVG